MAPRNGPRASARPRATPTSEASQSHRPRASSALRRSAPAARRPSSSTTWANRHQRTASQIATGRRTTLVLSTNPGGGHQRKAAEQRAGPSQCNAVGPDRAHRNAFVDLDKGVGSRCLDEGETEQRQSRSDRDDHQHEQTRRLSGHIDSRKPNPTQNERLQDRDHDAQRNEQETDADEERRPLHVDAAGGSKDLAPGSSPRHPEGGARSPGRARHANQKRASKTRIASTTAPGLRRSWTRPREPCATASQKKPVAVGANARPEGTA